METTPKRPTAYLHYLGEEEAQQLVARLLASTIKNPDNNCWEGKTTHTGPRGGYTRIWSSKEPTVIYGHRLVADYYGHMPNKDAVAMHLCANRKCVNPSHIAWGSQKENAQQREQDKRNREEVAKRNA